MHNQQDNNNNQQQGQGGQAHQISSDLAMVSDMLPDNLTVMPTETRPFFPGITVPMTFSGNRFIETIKKIANSNQPFLGLALIKEMNQEDYLQSELYETGTVVRILKIVPVEDQSIQVLVQGLERFSHVKTIRTDPAIEWQVKYYRDPDEKPGE